MDKKKKIKFDYVRVYSYIGNLKKGKTTDTKPFPLEKILELAKRKTVEERTIPYYGEEVTLQTIEKDKENIFWQLQFVRERTAEVPGIIDKNKSEFNPLDLDDDEYIGEEITVLYYEKTNTLMVQRNRNALGIGGIQLYFNQILNDANNIVELKLIPFKAKIHELRKLNLRKIQVSFAAIREDSIDDKNDDCTLLNIIRGANKMRSLNTNISFSVGKGGSERSLSPEEIESFVNLAEDEKVKKIHLEYKISEDAPTEIVELVNGNLRDEYLIEYSKEKRIEYKRVNVIMVSLFKDKLPYLSRIFLPKK